jgi:hypothetical protein
VDPEVGAQPGYRLAATCSGKYIRPYKLLLLDESIDIDSSNILVLLSAVSRIVSSYFFLSFYHHRAWPWLILPLKIMPL